MRTLVKGSTMKTRFAVCLIVLCYASSSNAASLLVDINDRSGTQPLQAGYVGVTLNGTGVTPIASDIGTIGLTFTSVAGGALDDRDRGALDASQPLSDLLRDIMFVSGGTGSGIDGTFDMTVSGLIAGAYSFKAYMHDNVVNQIAADVLVSVDGGANFSMGADDALNSTTTNPPVVGTASFNFVADGTNDVVFRMIGQGDTGAPFEGNETVVLSGFEITAVPEPASWFLLSIGVALLGTRAVARRLR